MADLPRILQRTFASPGGLPQANLPRTNAAAYGAGAFGALAQGFANMAEAARAADEADELQRAGRLISDVELATKENLAKLNEAPDEEGRINYFEQSNLALTRVEDGFKKQLGEFSQPVQQKLRNKLEPWFGERRLAARERHQQLSIQNDRGQLITSLESLAGLAAQAETPQERHRIEEFAQTWLAESRDRGVINPVEFATEEQKFRAKVAGQREAYFQGELQEKLQVLVNKASTTPMNATDLAREGENQISLAGDFLPKKEQDKFRRAYRSDVWASAIGAEIDKTPEVSLKQLRSGQYDDRLAPQAKQALMHRAEVEIDKRQRVAQAELRARHSAVKDVLKDFREASMLGYQWAGNAAQLQRAVSQFPDLQAEFRQAAAFADAKRDFSTRNDVQREAFIRDLEQRPQTGDSAKFLESLRSADTKIKTELGKDPLSFAARQGLIPPLQAVDPNNPATLQQRSEQARFVEAHYGRPVSPFTDDESAALIGQLNKIPADGKAQVMRQLNQSLPQRQVQAFAAQMDKKGAGELAQAFGMAGQVPEVSSRILQGIEAKRANKDVLPQGAEMREMDEAINSRLAEAYKANSQALDNTRDAIKSYYAWGRWHVSDLSGKLDSKALNRAIYAVTGGVLDFNGAPTLPPRYGTTESEFRQMVGRADYSQAPFTGDLSKAILRSGKLTAVGPGLYTVTIGVLTLKDKNDKPFILDLNR